MPAIPPLGQEIDTYITKSTDVFSTLVAVQPTGNNEMDKTHFLQELSRNSCMRWSSLDSSHHQGCSKHSINDTRFS